MHVLVTGATRFIGFHITRQLVTEGRRVLGFELIPKYTLEDALREYLDDMLKNPEPYMPMSSECVQPHDNIQA